MLIVGCNPNRRRLDEFKGTGPVLQPQAFFLERTHYPLGIRIALGIELVASFANGPNLL